MRGLIVLNASLLCVLALVTLAPGSASGQSRQPRAHGQYAVVSGLMQGRTEAGIYVVDASNEEVVAMLWDSSRRRYSPVGYRDLRADLERAKRKGR